MWSRHTMEYYRDLQKAEVLLCCRMTPKDIAVSETRQCRTNGLLACCYHNCVAHLRMVKIGNFVLCVCSFTTIKKVFCFFFCLFLPQYDPSFLFQPRAGSAPRGPHPQHPFPSLCSSDMVFVGFQASA